MGNQGLAYTVIYTDVFLISVSGVFRISARRGEGPWVSRGVGCGERAWAPPQKKIIFVPKNGAAFNVQKTRTITGNLAWDTDFTVQSQNEAYENSAKIIQKKSWSDQGGAVTPSPPP